MFDKHTQHSTHISPKCSVWLVVVWRKKNRCQLECSASTIYCSAVQLSIVHTGIGSFALTSWTRVWQENWFEYYTGKKQGIIHCVGKLKSINMNHSGRNHSQWWCLCAQDERRNSVRQPRAYANLTQSQTLRILAAQQYRSFKYLS